MRFLPNVLTTLRLLMGFVFPLIPHHNRFYFILIALLTEWLDGFLARKMNAISAFGRFLDPIADKVFVFSVITVLCYEDYLQVWQLLLVGLRDSLVVFRGLRLIWKRQWEQLKKTSPRWWGKVTTAFQFSLLLQITFTGFLYKPLFWVTVFLSLLSTLDYYENEKTQNPSKS